MPVYGLGQGLMPIVGYNFGHKHPKRIIKVVKISFFWGTFICLLGFFGLHFFPSYLLEMFGGGQTLMRVGVRAFSAASYGMPFVAIMMLGGMVFQAMGLGLPSLAATLIRQVLVLFPLMLFFSYKFGLEMLWYSIPISTFLSFVFMVCCLILIVPKKLRALA